MRKAYLFVDGRLIEFADEPLAAEAEVVARKSLIVVLVQVLRTPVTSGR